MKFPVGHQGRLHREGNTEAVQFWKPRCRMSQGRGFRLSEQCGQTYEDWKE